MEKFGIALALGIGLAIVSWIWSIIKSSFRQNKAMKKAVSSYMDAEEKSEGLEKVRLMVRESLTIHKCTEDLKYGQDGKDWLDMRLAVMNSYITICDSFYGSLDDVIKKVNGKRDDTDYDIVLARKVKSDFSLRKLLGYRIMTLSFLIILAKAAKNEHSRLSKKNIYSYIDNMNVGEINKKEMLKIAKWFIAYEKDEVFGIHSNGPSTSHELGEIAYALLNMDLEGKFGDIAIVTFMGFAISMAYGSAKVDKELIKQIRKEKLIAGHNSGTHYDEDKSLDDPQDEEESTINEHEDQEKLDEEYATGEYDEYDEYDEYEDPFL